MSTKPKTKTGSRMPSDAVLLIPEPEEEHIAGPFDVAPGYYNPKQLLELLLQHKHNPGAVHFIADMLETGNPEYDEFAVLLRTHHADPAAIARIIEQAGA